MNEETVTLIEQLAAQLGTSTSTVIEWYAKQAYMTWVGMILWIVMIAGCLYTGMYCKKKVEQAIFKNLEPIGYIVVGAMAGIIGLAALMGFCFETYDVVMAFVSPEAYALDRILENFNRG